MRVPLAWLGEMVDPGVAPEELAARLTAQGLAVEAIERLGEGLVGVYAARVDGLERHPRADGLWVVFLDVGGRRLTVVTGAQNLRAGDVVPWIEPGATLPGYGRIEARALRGVPSEGMLLSAAEMGIGPDADGIFVLAPDVVAGADVARLLGLPEPVLELDLTPNMAVHCQSIAGVAREVAAAYGAPLRLPAGGEPPHGRLGLRVEIEDAGDCPRYALGLVEWPEAGERGPLGPTPFVVRRRLLAAGVRLHGLAVDVTNYVMLELGQPLHAFDADALRGAVVGVRRARSGERLRTLDGQERTLGPEQLVIVDADGPVGLAGVMGGLDSEVTQRTRRVLFESAVFRPAVVRRSGRSLGLSSDAQARFERGVDPGAVPGALARALALCAGAPAPAHIHPGSIDVGPASTAASRVVRLRPARVAALLGLDLDAPAVAAALERLGFAVSPAPDLTLSVDVPTRRGDVEGEVDLIEEVGRLLGYDRLEARLPVGRTTLGRQLPERAWQEALADAIAGQGLTEVVTTSLYGADELDRWGFAADATVRLDNPLGPDADSLRPSLLPGLVRVLRANLERGRDGVWVFERGTVTARAAAGTPWPFVERQALATLAYGPRRSENWRGSPEIADVFALKAVVAPLLDDAYGPEGVGWRVAALASDDGWAARLHPGRSARIVTGGETVAVFGELHPARLAALDLPGPVIYFEWWHGGGPVAGVRALALPPRFPAVSRDVAVVLADAVAAATVLARVREAGAPFLEDVRVFDVYRGRGIPEGARSLALRLRYRAAGHTLREDEVEPVHEAVREALRSLGGKLRS